MPNYLNFDLHIDRDTSGDYTVKVLYSPAGEMPAPIPFRIPFSGAVLENHLLKLKLALRNAGLVRASHTPTKEEQAVQEFGTKLFTAAFADKALSLYDASRTKARSQGCGLRVRLRINPPELAALPWEFLYNPDLGDFVCLNVNTPLIRYLEMGQEIDPLRVQMPLNVLAVSAQPDGVDRLSVEREKDRIRSAFGELSNQGLLYVGWLDNPSLSELQAHLRAHPWHVLHFMGHGGFDAHQGGVVVMRQEDDSRYALITAQVLGRALENAPTLRLVFLNACETSSGDERDIFSSTAATLARRGIPAVLAMQFEVTDAAAIAFARTFYESVATGQPIDTAVSQARVAITARSALTLEWGTPVLTMRSSDGVLFEVEKQPSPPTSLPHAVEGRKTPVGATHGSPLPPRPAAPDPKALYDQAGDLDEGERYAESIPLYEQLLGLKPPYRESSVRTLLAQAQELLIQQQAAEAEQAERERIEQEKAARLQAAQERFTDMETLVKRARTDGAKAAAREAIQAFTRDYPEYKDDPQVAALWEQVKPPPPPPPPKPTRKRSMELLPAPFAWIEIPKKGYSIAKYPLTNAQFAPFIKASGYTEDRWWTKAGIEARKQGIAWDGSAWKPTGTPWTEPRYWQDSKWNQPEHPVVGVSWFEAVAYCLWLSETTGEKIMLPTEDQWQYAAQGDDGRDYPWGKKWDASRCNNNVDSKGIGKTSPVRQYEGKGDSPFGVVDMSGNVWEWCLTDYDNKTNELNSDTNKRVLRGGSWGSFNTGLFRCDYRDWLLPELWGNDGGFRLALS